MSFLTVPTFRDGFLVSANMTDRAEMLTIVADLFQKGGKTP